MDEDDYPSDSEQSDEDYCPDEQQEGNFSEVDSDDNVDETEPQESESGKKSASKKLKTAKSIENRVGDLEKSADPEVATENEDEDKSRADALWADFLIGTDPLPIRKSETKTSTVTEQKAVSNDAKPETKSESKKLVTEIFDFAGEKVEITKEIKETASSPTNNKSDNKPSGLSARRPQIGGLKRGGVGSVLGQLAKKNKISVLDKSKHDWDSFKRTEGIDEELQNFNRGRDGYLDRQDFLERTDVRQFELEKSMRLSRRNKR